MNTPEFLTPEEAATRLRVSVAHLRSALAHGQLPSVDVAGELRIPSAALGAAPRVPAVLRGPARAVLMVGLAAAVVAVSIHAVADVLPGDAPLRRTIPYAGTAERDGAALQGTYAMQFRLENEGGAPLWVENQDVTVSGGRFSVELGAVTALNDAVFASRAVMLAVTVDGVALGGRQRILAAFSDAAGANMVPVGTIQAYAGTTAPPGWLACDGSALRSAQYPQLHAVIGARFGNGTTGANAAGGANPTNFNLPDFRGRFLRGANLGAGRDPDAASRGAMAPGGAVGDSVGTVQDNATRMPFNAFVTGNDSPDHAHTVTVYGGSFGDGAGAAGLFPGHPFRENRGTSGASTRHQHPITGGDSETRPRNAAVMYIIRY